MRYLAGEPIVEGKALRDVVERDISRLRTEEIDEPTGEGLDARAYSAACQRSSSNVPASIADRIT